MARICPHCGTLNSTLSGPCQNQLCGSDRPQPDPRDRELASLRETEKAFHDLRNEHAEWQAERCQLQDRVKQLEAEIRRLHDKYDLQLIMKRIKELERENQDNRTRLSELWEERDQAQARVKELEAERDNFKFGFDMTCRAQQRDLDWYESEVNRICAERDQAQARVKELEGLLCNAEQTLDAARKELQRLDKFRRLAAGRREGVIGVHERLLEEARAERDRYRDALERIRSAQDCEHCSALAGQALRGEGERKG